jgi:hypothetical protein
MEWLFCGYVDENHEKHNVLLKISNDNNQQQNIIFGSFSRIQKISNIYFDSNGYCVYEMRESI